MRLGLTYTGTDAKHQNYVQWLEGNSPEVEVIRLSATDDNLAALRQCDGLVLSGGVDIHPALYGGNLAYTKAPAGGWQKERDLFEQSALRAAWERGLPVLGVCRGLQLINVSLKGTLVQDLGPEGDGAHENTTGVDKLHPVTILEGTLLAGIAGQERGVANSAHHQAIDRLGEGLKVNCRAGDGLGLVEGYVGIIEGIEWADPAGRPFLLAVQWHPERMYVNDLPDTGLYRAIRQRFIEEVKKSTATT